MAARHYLVLQVTRGQGFDLVYYPLAHEGETVGDATERWLDEQLKGRQRNVAKARRAAQARIEDARIARPTSWYREHGLGAFAEATPGGRMTPRRRR